MGNSHIGDEPKAPHHLRLTRRAFGRRAAAVVPAVLGGSVVAGSLAPQAAQASDAATSWALTGNAGTSSETNFVGTKDNQAFVVRTNNVERMRVAKGGNVGIGTSTPGAALHARIATGVAGLFARTAITGTDSTVRVTTGSADAVALRAENLNPGQFKGVAIAGYAASGSDDRVHPAGTFWDGAGEFCGHNGIIGAASTDVSDGYGVIGVADNSIGVGVYARGTGGAKALVASGDADVLGTLTKSGGSFRIDHPLAPAEKFLSHSFVESPDMKNVYDGVVTADARGSATVPMPEWFEALNRDFRYQLTAIGGPAPDLHVATKLTGGRFTISGARPGQEVSWQLTGIRHDRWADAHRIPVEQDKLGPDRGRYLTPALYGADETSQIGGRQGRPDVR